MAVTSIWPIKSRLDHVINYVRNPEKTQEGSYEKAATLHEIQGVIEYAANDMKTETRAYVTCLNLTSEETAASEFMETKQVMDNQGGRLCYHGYQSFGAEEVDAATAHEIGVKLAQELWGDRFQVIVATHCNTGHYHNHFVVNSVSDVDGKKFYNSPADYRQMREVSDRLCEEYGLSVIYDPVGRKKNYGEYLAEKNGKPTARSLIRADIDRGIDLALSEREFFQYLQSLGYELRLTGSHGQEIKSVGLKPPDSDHFFRFNKLGDGYSLEAIRERILEKCRRKLPFSEEKKEEYKKYREKTKPVIKPKGLHALYLHYCYELRIVVKYPASVKRVSLFMREDLTKLDQLDAQTRFIGANRIETMSDLSRVKEEKAERLETLIQERRALRITLKRAVYHDDQPQIERIKQKIDCASGEIRTLRKELKLCEQIEERSGKREAELKNLYSEQIKERKENDTHELFGRSGGASRQNVTGDWRGRS